MNSKKCSHCKRVKLLIKFNVKNKEKGWYNSYCKLCHSKYRKKHYQKNRDKYLEKAKKWNGHQTIILREYIGNFLLEHPCVDCGITDIRVLDFDHGRDKDDGICQMIRACYSLEKVKKEINKCKVRCANCHRIKTFTERNYWKAKMGL